MNYLTVYATLFVLSLYLQTVLGLSPVNAGIILLAQPIFHGPVVSDRRDIVGSNSCKAVELIRDGIKVSGVCAIDISRPKILG